MRNSHRQAARTVVDSRGIWCPPTPLADPFKAWRRARIGDLIELRATEPAIDQDVSAWAKESANKVVEVAGENGYTKVVVRVTKRGKEVEEMSAFEVNLSEPDQTKETPRANSSC